MPHFLVHPSLFRLLDCSDLEPSEYSPLPHIISPTTQDPCPAFVLLLLDTATVITIMQTSRLLHTTVMRCREDFPDAHIIIATLKLKIAENRPLGELIGKIWTNFHISVYSFKDDTEIKLFLQSLQTTGERHSVQDPGLHTKLKSHHDNPWIAFLRCIPGVTERKAAAIAAAYPSYPDLSAAYREVDRKTGRKLLTKVKVGGSQIGEAVARKVYDVLRLEEDEIVK